MTVWMCWILIVECMMEIKSVCGNERVIFTVPVHIKKIHHTKTIYKIVEKPIYVESSGLRVQPLQSLRPGIGGEIGGSENSTIDGLDGNKTTMAESHETRLEHGNGQDAMTEVENRPSPTSPKNSSTTPGLFLNWYLGIAGHKNGVDPGRVRKSFFPLKTVTGVKNSRKSAAFLGQDFDDFKHRLHSSEDASSYGNHYFDDARPSTFAGDLNPKNLHQHNRIFVHGPDAIINHPNFTFHGHEMSTNPPLTVRGRNAFPGSAGRDQNQRNNNMVATRYRGGTEVVPRGPNDHAAFSIFGETDNGYLGISGPVTSVHECKEMHAIRGLAVHNKLGKPTVRVRGDKGQLQYQVQEEDNVDNFDKHQIVSTGLNAFFSATDGGNRDKSANAVHAFPSTVTSVPPPVIVKNVYYTLDPVVPYNDV